MGVVSAEEDTCRVDRELELVCKGLSMNEAQIHLHFLQTRRLHEVTTTRARPHDERDEPAAKRTCVGDASKI